MYWHIRNKETWIPLREKYLKKHLKSITEKGINTNKSYNQKIQVILLNEVYFSSSNVSTDTTFIVKDQMLNEKFTFCFKIIIKWNLTQSHAIRLKSAKYKLM